MAPSQQPSVRTDQNHAIKRTHSWQGHRIDARLRRHGLLIALAATISASCSQDVTRRPPASQDETQQKAFALALKPDQDEYLYELIIEERTVGAKTVMTLIEAEIKATVTRYDSGRLRFDFQVTKTRATSGPNRERQQPNPARAAAIRSLAWTSKHNPNGSVVDLTAPSDPEGILWMLGASHGIFGLAYPSGPVMPQRSWRVSTPGVEWQLAFAADWLATLEGSVATPPAPDGTERTQSIRARVYLTTGMPIEMVGDAAESSPGNEKHSTLRHWSLSLLE